MDYLNREITTNCYFHLNNTQRMNVGRDYNTPARTRLKDSGVINKYEAI